jgi:2-polyprenyl-3-methyl-5-hydroxy-6-metoxy-1,4-benzoquinol methylase
LTDLFKEKAENYDSDDWAKEIAPAIGSIILSKVPLHDQMRVMDFGAGTGLICSLVAPKVKKVTAVDISRSMLEKLKAKPALHTKVNTVCQDIMIHPIDETFDLVLSAFAMHHVKDTNQLIKTLAEHMATGSSIALIDLDKEDGSFHSDNSLGVFHCGFDRHALKSILTKHAFEKIDFVTAHQFTWNRKKYSAFLVTAIKGAQH